ncbi:hypothetical protein PTKIN_Ptkin11bG0054500 [Pterospermum kingtungense]
MEDQTSAASNMKTTTLPNEKIREKDAASNIKQVKRREKKAAKAKQNDGSDIVKSAGQEDDNLPLCASDPEVSKDHSPAGLSISNQLDGKFEEKLPTMSPPRESARRARTQMPASESESKSEFASESESESESESGSGSEFASSSASASRPSSHPRPCPLQRPRPSSRPRQRTRPRPLPLPRPRRHPRLRLRLHLHPRPRRRRLPRPRPRPSASPSPRPSPNPRLRPSPHPRPSPRQRPRPRPCPSPRPCAGVRMVYDSWGGYRGPEGTGVGGGDSYSKNDKFKNNDFDLRADGGTGGGNGGGGTGQGVDQGSSKCCIS